MTCTPFFTKDAIIDSATFGGSILFGTIPNGSDMAAVWGDSEDGRDLIAKIKDTPVACVQTENQFIFIYEMEYPPRLRASADGFEPSSDIW